MLEIKFYEEADDSLLKLAVIIARSEGKWVFCKHKERDTYEFPSGHREEGEDILATAKRELYEETGALEYSLKPVCIYSVNGFDGIVRNDEETYGMLYFGDISRFGEMPDFEMEKIELSERLPEHWTYQEVQPRLMEKAISVLFQNGKI
ncbi:8-oxo-dGTP diphosphatase [Anaerobium acetethylicum]|uniref:8-oxo-dGTP diphosphatase n=2 Tax=Anaerobium acetethylicum TaxID=1619234 RepID=A0A1D3TTX3_9FIRM|nr:8-oxo-dGTP diphosphatase [Anaerobium acetethylicum]